MSWQLIVLIAVGVAIILFVPVMVWAAAVSGLLKVLRDRLQRRFSPRKTARAAGETPLSRTA
jgi:hypothetical protein